MPYFHISPGLRGCYMPDDAYFVKADTRRELKAIVEAECDMSREAYGFGGLKAEIANVVATLWREAKGKERKSVYPYAIGFGRTRVRSDRPFGVFIAHATRAEYLESQGD